MTIKKDQRINAFLETSSTALDIRASTLHYKAQNDKVSQGEWDSLADFVFHNEKEAADLDSMVTVVLCWDTLLDHQKGRFEEVSDYAPGDHGILSA